MIWELELDDQGVGKMASSEDPFGLYYIKKLQRWCFLMSLHSLSSL